MKVSNTNGFKKTNRTLQNINFSKVLIVLLCIIFLGQGILTSPSYAVETKTMTIEFEENMTQNRSKTINIPNLQSVVKATVNTGNTNFSVSGEDVTINVSNGSSSRTEYDPYKYSKSVSDYRTSSSNSFPSNMGYSSDGYNGTLTKSGSSYVYSGNYTPADSKLVSKDKAFMGTSRTIDPTPGSIYYNSGGYKGTLYKTNSGWVAGTQDTHRWNAWYSGTVTRPASDTRVWRQNYSGVANKGGNDYYYSYIVTLEYIDNQTPRIDVSKPGENEYFV